MAGYYNNRRRINRDNNPRNSKSELFKKLTKLFSGPIVNYRTQTERDLTRRKMDKYRFRSMSGQQFKKTTYNPLDHLHANILATQNRSERYADFNQMEYTPEIASAMDIYADEMTTSSELQPLLKIECPNQELKSILYALYENILNLEFNLFGWCRSLCKFGDFFLYLDIDEEHGVKNAIGLPAHEIERLEGEDPTNPNYVQYQWNSGGMTFENWQVAHFRILGNDKFAPYGTSVLDPARRIWRQLTLLEDAMMAYRIVRSPERRVFYIDVGAIPPNEIEQYMQKVVTQMKRNQVVNQDTGRVDLRYNPLSIEEDYYIPTRGGNTSRIETLAGGSWTGDVDDVKYLRDKLFSALKIPASYLSNSAESEEDKTTLAQKDIRFARTIQRLQRSIITELEKVGIIHLYILGYRAKDLISFSLSLNNPSKIAAMQELEHWKLKFDIAAGATEGYFSRQWVAKNIFNLSDEEILRNQREMFYDRKLEAALEAAADEASEALAGATGEGGLEGELGGEEGLEGELGGEELEGEEGLEGLEGLEGEEEEIPGDDLLLAEPPKRDEEGRHKIKKKGAFGRSEQTTTSKSKGKWYKPVTSDGRESTGPRKKNIKAKWGNEKTKSTPRTLYPGYSPLKQMTKGITEEQETIYNEEKILFEVNKEIRDLISKMEKRDEAQTQ
jgi:hypothetical protein